MSDLISHVDVQLPPDSRDVRILSPVPVLFSTSDDSTETTSHTIVNIPKTVRDKFYVNIKTYETNWSGQLLQHSDCSTTREVNVTDDEQSTTPRSTPKRKSLFSNIERKSIKKQKIDNFAFIKDEITKYLNEDNSDSNR
ncbi:unnamed protein product, partial [Rotaria sp. Silwood2]